MKKKVAFILISFAGLKWVDRISVQVPFELPVQIPVQLLLELQANWLDQNVNLLSRIRWDDARAFMQGEYKSWSLDQLFKLMFSTYVSLYEFLAKCNKMNHSIKKKIKLINWEIFLLSFLGTIHCKYLLTHCNGLDCVAMPSSSM